MITLPCHPSSNSDLQSCPDSAANRFGAAAGTYLGQAHVQAQVAADLLDWVPRLSGRPPVVEIGCGPGTLTRLLLNREADARVVAVDAAAPMLAAARAAVGGTQRVQFIAADLCQLSLPQPVELIVSSSCLHWINPVEAAARALAGLLRPGGEAIVAVMLQQTLRELYCARLRVAPHKPPQQRLPSGDAVRAAFVAAGLQPMRRRRCIYHMHYPSAKAFLRSLNEQGVTGGSVSRAAVPLARQELHRLQLDYQQHYGGADGTVAASWEVLFLHARRASAGSGTQSSPDVLATVGAG